MSGSERSDEAGVPADPSSEPDASANTTAALDVAGVTRADVEDFLYHEAALLDAWALDEWLALFTPDGTYRVPSLETEDQPAGESLYFIADDMARLAGRVRRLQDPQAHAEFPHSRTRRLVTNVRIVARDGGALHTEASFAVHRFRRGEDVRVYVGRYRYTLSMIDGRLRIRAREAILDAHELGSLGAVSFIL